MFRMRPENSCGFRQWSLVVIHHRRCACHSNADPYANNHPNTHADSYANNHPNTHADSPSICDYFRECRGGRRADLCLQPFFCS